MCLAYCVANGGWSPWVCGSCSKTCGGGTQHCTRSCTNPTPCGGGKDCSGLSVDTRSCARNCCHGKIIT